ncbi:MAG: hypothetical protein L0332_18370 [Chloroflexi bacterium]|nr:hypothetical protein [Chloroflexota bacterium]MCI0578025.1 hypothetical protein [Chloroflexota bacterium]MCI0644761.1 hypothetical protein [Chloroflexota bacterium]MCI0728666.1 hypothetical protein [Chloroflexota bacterium]
MAEVIVPETVEGRRLRTAVAVLRMTLGVIILATWFDNLRKGIYTAQGLTDLFTHPDWGIFTFGGGAFLGYRGLVEATILQVPGLFATFQMVAELLMGLGLLLGALTPLAGVGATFFFFNLFLAYLGHTEEWIWTYVLLSVSAFVVTITRAGRELGLDRRLWQKWGEPPFPFLW